jgi:uncharacterized lipoprotein YbaY
MNDQMHTDDFERQVADVARRVVGPPRTVDALAVARQAATDPPTRRFPSMFSALKFVAASVIVALFGAFALAGILPSGSPEQAPPAAQATAPGTALLTGWVNTEGTDRPLFQTRMVVTLLDASNPDGDLVPLGEFVLEDAERLEAHAFAIEYDPDQIDENGTYVVDMRLERPVSGQIVSRAETQVPVITHGHPTKDVEIKLVLVDEPGSVGTVSGIVMADVDLADPEAAARLVVSLVEDAGDGSELVPLGEWMAEDITRLRPPLSFSLGYDTESAQEGGTYLLQARLEDAETGALLAAGTQAIADLANADSVTVRLSAPTE